MTFIDPNIPRKNALQNEHLSKSELLPGGYPSFSEFELNITGLCNRTCVFCPRVDPEIFPNVNEHLAFELNQKILEDLSNIGYSGRIVYSGFGEPLLHKDVYRLVSDSRKVLPNNLIEIVTNGDRLNPEVLVQLFSAGLSTLLISMYDGPQQIPIFESMVKKSGISSDRVILRKRYLPPEEGYGINLTNRGGTVGIQGSIEKELTEPLKQACFYTHYRMMTDYQGDVLLCPHDWGKKIVVANLNNESVLDVWKGLVLSGIRKRLGNGDRNFAPCNVCNVHGTRQGVEHFKAWQNINVTSEKP